jgi:hypothetical protein
MSPGPSASGQWWFYGKGPCFWTISVLFLTFSAKQTNLSFDNEPGAVDDDNEFAHLVIFVMILPVKHYREHDEDLL